MFNVCKNRVALLVSVYVIKCTGGKVSGSDGKIDRDVSKRTRCGKRKCTADGILHQHGRGCETHFHIIWSSAHLIQIEMSVKRKSHEWSWDR